MISPTLAQDLKAGDVCQTWLGTIVTLDYVEVFPARRLNEKYELPACVLTFYDNRRHSHTFEVGEMVNVVIQENLLSEKTERASADIAPTAESSGDNKAGA